MYNLLSKSFLISACIFGLVIGMVVQVISDRGVLPPMANVGAGDQPTTNVGRTLYGAWTSAVKLETGESLTFEKISLLAGDNDVTGGAWFKGHSFANVSGNYKGNHFSLLLEYYMPSIYDLASLSNPRFQFEGQLSGDNASGIVTFIDDYQQTFHGTFTFAHYSYKVTPPTPDDPGGSGSSVINGEWKGKFLYNGTKTYTHSITLNLPQQPKPRVVTGGLGNLGDGLANILGTGTIDSKQVDVNGNVAGSALSLQIGDLSTGITIEGQVTKDNIVCSYAKLYTGKDILEPGDPYPYLLGKANFSR